MNFNYLNVYSIVNNIGFVKCICSNKLIECISDDIPRKTSNRGTGPLFNKRPKVERLYLRPAPRDALALDGKIT